MSDLKPLHIEPTEDSPEIKMNPEGDIKIKGRSMAQEPDELYEETMQWMHKYVENPAPETNVELEYDYISTRGAKALLDMLANMKEMTKENTELKVVWKFSEDDYEERQLGNHIAKMVGEDVVQLKPVK